MNNKKIFFIIILVAVIIGVYFLVFPNSKNDQSIIGGKGDTEIPNPPALPN